VQALTRAIREAGPPAEPPASWRIWLSGILVLIGLGMSTYLTVVHFVGTQILVCNSGGIINCEAVITSPQSYVFGIPVAVLGLAYYVVMAVICSPWAWRAADRRVHLARLALVVVGIGFVLYLVSAELLVIKSLCELCTSVHVVTFAQLILVMATVPGMLGWGRPPEADTPSPPAPRRQSTNGRQSTRTAANGRQRERPVAARSRRR
jgi:uncharacterized membrane protein